MSDETAFVDGLYADKPSDKAPDFVKAKLSIKASKLCQWLNGNQDLLNNGYLNVDILETKDGSKYYCKINTFKPDASKAPPPRS